MSILAKQSLLLDTQHPESYKKVQILESLDKFPRTEIPDKMFEKPNFTQQLQNLDGLKEGQPAHLECHVEPAGDPKMRIEWFVNGRPLQNGKNNKLLLFLIPTFPDNLSVPWYVRGGVVSRTAYPVKPLTAESQRQPASRTVQTFGPHEPGPSDPKFWAGRKFRLRFPHAVYMLPTC